MKKILVFVSLLIFVGACAPQPDNKNMTSNANKGSEMKSTGAVSEADIIAKEKAAWDAVKKKDWDAFGKLMTSDYLEVLDDGVHDKAATLQSIKDFELTDVTFADWKMLSVDKDAVIITYTATVKGTYKGQAIPPGPYREGSSYVNRNGEWLSNYYQETLSRTAPPSPTPAAKTTSSPAGAMAKPPETGSDPIANEKLVWDALKSKNYDAFAFYLSADSMNIEPDGVYDKSGSVNGVSMGDFSKTQLSDWKTLKFDDDASLVTYVVKGPGMTPDTEYHSTIWANRDGKWKAVFHQGTPAAKPEAKK